MQIVLVSVKEIQLETSSQHFISIKNTRWYGRKCTDMKIMLAANGGKRLPLSLSLFICFQRSLFTSMYTAVGVTNGTDSYIMHT